MLDKKSIIKILNDYNLDKNKYMLISGAALVFHGIKNKTHDIDIAVDKDYYNLLLKKYDCKFDRINEFNNDTYFIDDFINFGTDYYKDKYDINDGIKVQSINDIKQLKSFLNRKKDINDIRCINEYLINNYNVNKKLKKYIKNNIFPIYKKNDLGHNLDHILYVIERSLRFSKNVNDINYDMVYVASAYHDIGHFIDAKNHEKVSAKMFRNDKFMKNFFSKDQIKIISDAIEDHRSSNKNTVRNIYGKIVSTADKNTFIYDILRRTYNYRIKHSPKSSLDEIINDSKNHIKEKFGYNGYARKTYFKDNDYEKFLNSIDELLNSNNFKKMFCVANKIDIND